MDIIYSPSRHQPITSLHPLHHSWFITDNSPLRRVVVLDAALGIRVHEASTTARALGRAAARNTRAAIVAQRAAETKQHSGDEEAGERGPGEAQQVAADGRLEASGAEGVAALDDPGAECVSIFINKEKWWRVGEERTSAAQRPGPGRTAQSRR